MLDNSNANIVNFNFASKFESLRGKRIAVYGTGDNAYVILNNIGDFDFICVISTENCGNRFCGYPIYSLSEALPLIDVIFIAAGPPSTNIVFDRIKNSIPDNITVFDMRGHELTASCFSFNIWDSIVKYSGDTEYLDFLKKEGILSNENKASVSDYRSVALLLAPITANFFKYIIEYAKELDYLLFASRDGFFLHRLYLQYVNTHPGKWARGIYFYTSRTAIKKALDGDERSRYVDYISKLDLCGKGAVIDIVTQGSVVSGLKKLADISTELIAIGTTAIPNKHISDEKTVHSMLGNVNEEVDGIYYSFSEFSELHLFLEMLYASNEGQFVEIGKEDELVFDENEYNNELLIGVQDELTKILDSIEEKKMLFSDSFAIGLMKAFYRNFAIYGDDIKNKFSFNDPYDGCLKDCNLIDRLGW